MADAMELARLLRLRTAELLEQAAARCRDANTDSWYMTTYLPGNPVVRLPALRDLVQEAEARFSDATTLEKVEKWNRERK